MTPPKIRGQSQKQSHSASNSPHHSADATNPRGFAESQWVVDFHTRLLKTARVQVSDARPGAWALCADVSMEEMTRAGSLEDAYLALTENDVEYPSLSRSAAS